MIPTPKRDPKKNPILFIARSFDINKPGSDPSKMVGGVLGGALFQGLLKVGDQLELRPGHQVVSHGKTTWEPIMTNITGLKTGGDSVDKISPGGSVGIMTDLDPAVVPGCTVRFMAAE